MSKLRNAQLVEDAVAANLEAAAVHGLQEHFMLSQTERWWAVTSGPVGDLVILLVQDRLHPNDPAIQTQLQAARLACEREFSGRDRLSRSGVKPFDRAEREINIVLNEQLLTQPTPTPTT